LILTFFLEAILDQDKAEEAKNLFKYISSCESYISDFSLNSIGIILFKLNKQNYFEILIDDIIASNTEILSIDIDSIKELIPISLKYGLDFDDAYQYFIAEIYDLKIISFDKDFDKTEKGRVEPKMIAQII
jgi:predicted nucleic acid-binding protein